VVMEALLEEGMDFKVAAIVMEEVGEGLLEVMLHLTEECAVAEGRLLVGGEEVAVDNRQLHLCSQDIICTM
jgi:hypothetical protein